MSAPGPRGPQLPLLVVVLLIVSIGLRESALLLMPFLVSVLLVLLSLPLLHWLRRHRVPSRLAALITLAALVSVVAGVGALVEDSASRYLQQLPNHTARVAGMVAELTQRGVDWLVGLGVRASRPQRFGILDLAAVPRFVGDTLGALAELRSSVFLMLLAAAFLLFEAEALAEKLRMARPGLPFDPDGVEQVVGKVRRYLGVKGFTSQLFGSAVAIWLAILGVSFPLLWGAVAFVLNFVTGLGWIMAAAPAVLLAATELGGGWAVIVGLGYGILKLLLVTVIERRLSERPVDLSMPVVFLSLVFWGWAFGPIGVLIAVPLTVIVKIVLQSTEDARWIAVLLEPGSAAEPPPVVAASRLGRSFRHRPPRPEWSNRHGGLDGPRSRSGPGDRPDEEPADAPGKEPVDEPGGVVAAPSVPAAEESKPASPTPPPVAAATPALPSQIGQPPTPVVAAPVQHAPVASRTGETHTVRAVDVVGALMEHKISQEIAARFRRRRDLKDQAFPDVVQELARAHSTGELIVRRDGGSTKLLVRNGKLVFAQSSHPNDRLGEMLLVSGKISLDQYLDAQRGLHKDRRAGSVLVEIGAIQQAELGELILAQTRASICHLFTWTEGEYWIADSPDTDHEPISLKSSPSDVILDGIHRIDAWSQVDHGIGGAEQPYRRVQGFESRIAQMKPSAEQRALLDLLEHSHTVEDLCEASSLASIDVCRTLWAYKVIGAVEAGERDFAPLPGQETGVQAADVSELGRGQPVTSGGEAPGIEAPSGVERQDLRFDDFPDVLSRLKLSGTSGVLVVAHGSMAKRLALRDGRIVFAQSSDPDDRLGEQLLVERKISLREYRDAGAQARRGKRLGAALVEMGAIDADELIEVLGDQVRAIIYSLFEWTDGEFWFEEQSSVDPDATILRLNTADIIMEGIHRIDAWSRIDAALRGSAARYQRAADCESKVARMALTSGRRRLLSLLSEEWDVAGLCRVGEMPSIEVCRGLWAFKVIGAVEQID